MKNKGFTLIEMSGVFLILAIILIIAIPPIVGTLKKGSGHDYNRFLDTIYVATEDYIAEYDVKINDHIQISIEQLIKSGFLKSTVVNPKTDKALSSTPNMVVKVSIGDNGYEYKLLDQLEKEYIGVPSKNYNTGDEIDYMNNKWYVVKDNKNSLTLILAGNIETGIFGQTDNYDNSTVKQKLETWIKDHLSSEIEKGGLVNEDGKFVRLIKTSELSNKLSNDSNTPFWTANTNNGKVIVALSSGIYKYTNDIKTITIYNGSTGSGSNYREKNINIPSSSLEDILKEPNNSILNIHGFSLNRTEYGSTTIETAGAEGKRNYSFCSTTGKTDGYCPSNIYLCSYASANDCQKYDIYERLDINDNIGYRPVIVVNKK